MPGVPKHTESPFLRKVGTRIKQLREARHLTQDQLAERSGVHRVYLSGIERGIRNFTILHLTKIARVLRTSPGSLLDD
jgi:transcriptional regulator with XRE-family HTH domain